MKTLTVMSLIALFISNLYAQSKSGNKLEIINFYKSQTELLRKYKDLDEEKLKIICYDSLLSNKKWNSSNNYTRTQVDKMIQDAIVKNKDIILEGTKVPEVTNKKIQSIADSIYKMTGVPIKGKLVFLYSGLNYFDYMCIPGNIMLIDLLHKNVDLSKFDRLPHEMSHLAYEYANLTDKDPEKRTILEMSINEGLACLTECMYDHKNNCLAVFSDSEYNWCMAHEKMILDSIISHFEENYQSEMYGKLFYSSKKLIEGGPSRIGYFFGLRVCQSYIDKYGMDSYPDLFILSANAVLEKSDYIGMIMQ